MKKYLVVIEETGTGYSAYSPDLDGCIATGQTREEVEREMQEAIEFHLEGMARNGADPRAAHLLALCGNSGPLIPLRPLS
jgi:predicted RNase H-like HicB family nuclease